MKKYIFIMCALFAAQTAQAAWYDQLWNWVVRQKNRAACFLLQSKAACAQLQFEEPLPAEKQLVVARPMAKNDAQIWRNLFFAAVKDGKIDVVRDALAKGIDINERQVDKSRIGRTALIIAVEYNNPKMVEFLVARDANLQAANNKNMTPLMITAREGNNPMAQLLLALGAEPNYAPYLGVNALWHAVSRGHVDVVQTLLTAGASPAKTYFGKQSVIELAQVRALRARDDRFDRIIALLQAAQ